MITPLETNIPNRSVRFKGVIPIHMTFINASITTSILVFETNIGNLNFRTIVLGQMTSDPKFHRLPVDQIV